MGQLCPTGVESTVFALVTSIQMVGGTVSGTLSSYLTSGLGVTLTVRERERETETETGGQSPAPPLALSYRLTH
jgi:hypothetical protein